MQNGVTILETILLISEGTIDILPLEYALKKLDVIL